MQEETNFSVSLHVYENTLEEFHQTKPFVCLLLIRNSSVVIEIRLSSEWTEFCHCNLIHPLGCSREKNICIEAHAQTTTIVRSPICESKEKAKQTLLTNDRERNEMKYFRAGGSKSTYWRCSYSHSRCPHSHSRTFVRAQLWNRCLTRSRILPKNL